METLNIPGKASNRQLLLSIYLWRKRDVLLQGKGTDVHPQEVKWRKKTAGRDTHIGPSLRETLVPGFPVRAPRTQSSL